MKEPKANHIEIDIISENCVKIQAKCNPRMIEERNYESKESLFQISNNSLVLSNTLSSLNTIRVSKNSLAGSQWMGAQETQNRETPKKHEKRSPEEKNGHSNFVIYDVKKSDSTEIKKQTKYQNLKIEISKINNFVDKVTKNEEEESLDEKNNDNLCSQSIIYLSKNDDPNKLEISNKSIFFTPSTICNYYQPSYLENSPNQENSKFKSKNLEDLEGDIIPKAINMDMALSKLTPPQIKYTKGQLQSQERNDKQMGNNSNNNKSKDIFVPACKNKINFESETNNFTLQNIIFDENKEKNEKKESKKEFQTFHDLVNEIKKELVLNISAIEDDLSSVSNNNILGVEEEEKSKIGCSNFFVKNLGLNFCEMKINKQIATASVCENMNKFEIVQGNQEDQKNDQNVFSRMRKNCLSCISEISLNIKPCGTKNEEKTQKNKNLSSHNLIIQRPDNISISLDEKKIPTQNSKVTSSTFKQKYISSLTKNKLSKNFSRQENHILGSYSKQGNSGSRVNSSKKESQNQSGNKSPDTISIRKDSKQKNLSHFDVAGNTKNKVLKSIIMNLVGNLIEPGCQKESKPKGNEHINKTVISPTNNPQTTITATQSSYQKTNTTNSVLDTDRNFVRPNSNNNGIINNKKKEYLELIKLLSSNNDSHNRNKPKVQDQRTNSKGKTFEVSINLDQSDKRNNSGRKSSVNNTSQNNSKNNSLSKKDTNSTVKKANSNRSILPPELTKMQSMKLDNRNTKKTIAGVPFNNCPQTSKNPQKKNLVSELMNQQQKKVNQTKKPSDKMFININQQTPTQMSSSKKNSTEVVYDSSNKKKEENSSTKHNTNSTILNMDRKCESYQNQLENRSLFKNESTVVNMQKHKSDSVKIINNFSNYTKSKKDSAQKEKGKENVNYTNDSSYENKKQVTALQIRNSGGDEDSVFVDEN